MSNLESLKKFLSVKKQTGFIDEIYEVHDISIGKLSKFKDLGVIFEKTLYFECYYSLQRYGHLLITLTNIFENIWTLLTLYKKALILLSIF